MEQTLRGSLGRGLANDGRWRWLAWWLALGVWTFALLYPFSHHEGPRKLPADVAFSVSKALHVSGYAFLAGALAWLPATRRRRWWALGLLAAHAVVGEVLQHAFPALGRTGKVADVALDLVGVGLGLALTRRWWRRPPPPWPTPPASA